MINHNENEDENESRSHRCDINRPSPRRGHKYNIYKRCLSMTMLVCIKQHLSKIWSSIQEKSWAILKLKWKKALLIKKAFSTTSDT